MVVYVVLVGATACLFQQVPSGFVPGQDKQYLVGFAQLPDGATLDRTEEVIRKMTRHRADPARCRERGRLPGPVDHRLHQLLQRRHRVLDAEAVRRAQGSAAQSGSAIAAELNKKYAGIQDAFIAMFPPPPVNGLGTIGGFKLQIEDRAGLGYEALNEATKAIPWRRCRRRRRSPACSPASRSTCRSSSPTSTAPRRCSSACPSPKCSTRCRSTSARYYVNDFNKFGRTYQVYVQADAPFRARADDIGS